MRQKMKTVREVFGPPDIFTIHPVTFAEMNPVIEARYTDETSDEQQEYTIDDYYEVLEDLRDKEDYFDDEN